MSIQSVRVRGYRSLRDLSISPGQLTVVTGPNGSGKSNLYRALWLISRIAEGSFAQTIAREGGLLSVMWAGPRLSPKEPVRMFLEFHAEDFGFEIQVGFPPLGDSPFPYDPVIKEETIWHGPRRKPSTTLVERRAGATLVRDVTGAKVHYALSLADNESILSQLRDPERFPELYSIRDAVKRWRFYHTFRTDEQAPLRFPRSSVNTPVLASDGSDLAAALKTIFAMGDAPLLQKVISQAFPGRHLVILSNDDDPRGKSPRFTELAVGMTSEGCIRPLLARELSDGTLKFLCLAAALLSPRSASFMVLNEPESSLHPDLLPSLAELIVAASAHSQILVCSHSPDLLTSIERLQPSQHVDFQLHEGETVIRDPHELDN